MNSTFKSSATEKWIALIVVVTLGTCAVVTAVTVICSFFP